MTARPAAGQPSSLDRAAEVAAREAIGEVEKLDLSSLNLSEHELARIKALAEMTKEEQEKYLRWAKRSMDYSLESLLEWMKKQGVGSTKETRAEPDLIGHAQQNGRRRTKAEMDRIRDSLREILEAENPMTVRQVFYQAVSRGLIQKTEAEYQGTIVRLLSELRRAGEIPFDWIADSTRWMRKPRTYSGMESFLAATTAGYRRAIWDQQHNYVEIWLEKEALAGVLVDVTAEWDAPLMVCKGYPSLTFLHSSAEAIAEKGKPTFIYYFGDHDPSGVDIPRKVEEGIRTYAPNVDLEFECVAVTEEQIVELNLPTRPTKKTDSRSKNFDGESVELDAIPSTKLRYLADLCIKQHIDKGALERLLETERAERETLKRIPELLKIGQKKGRRA